MGEIKDESRSSDMEAVAKVASPSPPRVATREESDDDNETILEQLADRMEEEDDDEDEDTKAARIAEVSVIHTVSASVDGCADE